MAGEFTLTELQTQLKALLKARNAGVLFVQHGDTKTQFQSAADMNKTILNLRREIAALSGNSKSRINYVKQCTKGL